ncbi:hypothetical protein S40285_06424 [Stachybotrys chlorohalonatus IBT 40285]|uniref:Uncharacterized protein n=1 Tax=Stachybotrys chlorohalonatus (strain IBT 40285) TaxID=1283841 RepID=A0A084QEL9_STAC4|nr:hypothetical protein S40285_06424 [Stachybotrys chlorohalonata IBT 40285]
MAPIRLAIVGLSSSAITSWASGAHLPYLQSARGRAKYQIVALLNSSVDAARQAVAAYNLPAETRTYGDPQSLADDPDVDLIVNCTRVDNHFATILPSVRAGRSVFVEWPLAQDGARVAQLVEEARRSGSRTVVGLQGRLVPVYGKIREVLEQGRIGKVLSSEVLAAGGTNDRERLPEGLKYFADRSVGGNPVTIGFGHLFDQIQHLLGDFENLHGHLHLQRPNVTVFDPSTKATIDTIASNVPDLIIVTATLAPSPMVQPGASVLVRYRRGQTFPGQPPLTISINGEKGELRLTARSGAGIHANSYDAPVTIEVHDHATDKVEEVQWAWADWQEELPVIARNVGMVYEAYAEGKDVATFENAQVRHNQLNGMLSAWAKE